MPGRLYSKFIPPNLAMSELMCQKLDNDTIDLLIDKWLARPETYHDWFYSIRERKHQANIGCRDQLLLWNKGDFVPENIFTRTVDTGRLIPLDRTWVSHIYHHRSMQRLTMMPVIFSMLPELMLLRGMHDRGCDDVYIIVTDLKRHEMDQIAEYFMYVCQNTALGCCKPSVEQKINHDYITLNSTLDRRTPCFPQIDLTFRALLHEKRPPFIVLFSHQTMSYSQIFFAHPSFVPSKDVYYDFPSGCPNPGCTDNCCELIRFPKQGLEDASVLYPTSKKKKVIRHRYGRRARPKEMCNWIECDVCFADDARAVSPIEGSSEGSTEGSQASVDGDPGARGVQGLICSRCRIVKYCSAKHQRLDWEEHKRICAKPQTQS